MMNKNTQPEVQEMQTSFMDGLLDVIQQQGIALSEKTCFIFPNRRAGLFFQKALAHRLEQPMWCPQIFSVSEFVVQHTKTNLADKLSLNIQLFNLAVEKKIADKTFDRFYPWGEMLLKDFDEIDKYLADARSLFQYINDVKQIEAQFDFMDEEHLEVFKHFWANINNSKESEHRNAFLTIWEQLFELYDNFKKVLSEQGIAYEGMAYRALAENPDAFEMPYEKVIIAGFNALSKSEEVIFKHWCKQNKALIVWDADCYYFNNPVQEAGHYIRKFHKEFANSHLFLTDTFHEKSKQIDITSVAMSVGQAKLCSGHLQDALKLYQPEEIAIVLPDESLLFPMLYSLPEKVSSINITMGYPLKDTPIFHLIESLLDFQLSMNPKQGKVPGRVYYTHVLSLLEHPYINPIAYEASNRLINQIRQNNQLFVGLKQLQDASQPELFRVLFQPCEHVNQVLAYLKEVLSILYKNQQASTKQGFSLEQEFVYQAYQQLEQLTNTLTRNPVDLNVQTLARLFTQMLAGVRLPFTGEPLQGLQIMGILETRMLDFKQVFILSMNEGNWPAPSGGNSFIPYQLRKSFDLPTPEQTDAMYGYYFYRLLQRAEAAHLYYDNATGQGNLAEKSRFLQQLQMELPFSIPERLLTNNVVPTGAPSIVAHKDRQVMEGLERYICKDDGTSISTLSASALNTYIACKLRFYYQYVLRLREPDEVVEELDNGSIGELFHAVMEILYKRLKTRKVGIFQVTASDVDAMVKELEEGTVFEEAFKQLYEYPDLSIEGRNRLIELVVVRWAKRVLEFDKAYAPFEIIGLETGGDENEAYKRHISIAVLGDSNDPVPVSRKVNLAGRIDRIDLKGNEVRIIDYKTGRADLKFGVISDLFLSDEKAPNKAALQALLYGWLYRKQHPERTIQLHLFQVHAMFKQGDSTALKWKSNPQGTKKHSDLNFTAEVEHEFELHLQQLLEELYNPKVPFTQTADLGKCEFCTFANLCGKN